MTATVIILGFGSSPVRQSYNISGSLEDSLLPYAAVVDSPCTDCEKGKRFVFDTANACLMEMDSQSPSKPASEAYVLKFNTMPDARSWINDAAHLDWLSDPARLVFAIDGDVTVP